MEKKILEVNEKLKEFAQRIPAKGMHMSYLDKASEVMELYADMLAIMEEDQTTENEERFVAIATEIEKIIK